MNLADKQTFIRHKAVENHQSPGGTKILWSRHALTETAKDNLSRQEVETALVSAEVIEDYESLRRTLPDCLVLGFLLTRRPVHAVVAVDVHNDRLFMITVYLPAKEKWKNDWRTRK